MKFLSTLVIIAALSVFSEALSLHHEHVHRSHHNRLLRRGNTARCKQRPATPNQSNPGSNNNNNSSNNTSGNNNNNGSNNQPNSSPAANSNPAPSPSPSPSPAPNTSPSYNSGLIQVQDWSCGGSGATQDVTSTTGPNGALDWMNCGIDAGGWNPPFVHVSDLVTVELNEAISQGGPFTACTGFVWAFEQFGQQYGLPPILLASIALQESSCNPGTVGGNGEQGLMQLTQDKCGGAPGGNCQDVGYNIMTGAKYFSDQLAANGGNFFLTLGSYNGWVKGMTIDYATRMRYTACHAQNNLDYLFQTTNGWMLNKDAYSMGLGKYHNLDGC